MKKGQSRDAYCALIKGETIVNEFDEFGDMVGTDRISQVQYSHPCLAMEIERSPKNGRRVSARLTDHQAFILEHPRMFYEGEIITNEPVWVRGQKLIPNNMKHVLVIHGKNVERDAYYITVSSIGRSMETMVQDILLHLAEVKAYERIAGLDVYYQDGRHKQYAYTADHSISGGITKILSEAALKVNKVGALVYKRGRGDEVVIPDQQNIAAIRALYFGQLIMM